MPSFLAPHKSGAHRIAAIALYRAILSQCKALKLEEPHGQELQNLVRNRFKQVRHLQSHRRLSLSFEAGYQAVDCLDGAVAGDVESREYIVGLVERAPASVKKAPLPVVLPKSKRPKRAIPACSREGGDGVEGGDILPPPPPQSTRPPSLFDRPLPLSQLSGRRRVPILASANRIPILRLTKPQPASLSHYINSRIKLRQARQDRKDRLVETLELAKAEDEWDGMVERQLADNGGGDSGTRRGARAIPGRNGRQPMWTTEIYAALDEVHWVLNEERDKNRVMAEKMQGVVDRERQMAEVEKRERQEEKAAKWRERKGVRESGMTAAHGDVDAERKRPGMDDIEGR